jgi:hypothetical protein
MRRRKGGNGLKLCLSTTARTILPSKFDVYPLSILSQVDLNLMHARAREAERLLRDLDSGFSKGV